MTTDGATACSASLRRPYDPALPLISIHVPKCAGRSFRLVLERFFGERLRLHYYNEQEQKMPVRHDLRRVRGACVHGHFNEKRGFGVEDYYPDAQQFITILRDPFQMHLSNYFYRKSLGPRWVADGGAGRNRELYPDVNRFVRNRPCPLMKYMPGGITLENFREVLSSRFVYVGISEDLQTSVNVLARVLGVEPVEVPVVGAAERDEEVDPGLEDLFRERNPLEHAIYRFARETYSRI